MAPRAKKAGAVKRKDGGSTSLVNTVYQTSSLTNLPTELLHMIMAEVHHESYATVKACSLTCQLLREVALEYLRFKWCLALRDLPHLLAFVRNHPRLELGKTVTSLSLRHSTVHAKVMGEMTRLLPNLSHFSLEDVRALPLSRGDTPDSNAAPLRLSRMDIYAFGSDIPGLMHILSSFDTQHLFVTAGRASAKVDSFDSRHLTRFPVVENLNVFTQPTTEKTVQNKSIARVVDALSKTLAPDCLRGLRVTYDSEDAVRAYGRIIERCGSRITSLRLHADAPIPFENRVGWVDALDEWRLLNVDACKELQNLEIPIYVPQEAPVRAVSHAAAGILAHHASPSLRKVAIMLHDLPRPTTLGNRVVLKLQEIDKVVTQARFPHLQEFELGIGVTYQLSRKRGYWEKCVAAARRALPGLHARGLLKITDKDYSL